MDQGAPSLPSLGAGPDIHKEDKIYIPHEPRLVLPSLLRRKEEALEAEVQPYEESAEGADAGVEDTSTGTFCHYTAT